MILEFVTKEGGSPHTNTNTHTMFLITKEDPAQN